MVQGMRNSTGPPEQEAWWCRWWCRMPNIEP